ncbi:MAG: CHRD domain-containing protein [Acidimicrobiia bacterium]|nr:CHRD domain-containing protein [Acidimicrobiia bacterium]
MHTRSRVAALTLAGSAAVVALAGVTVGAQTTPPDGDDSTTTLVEPTTTSVVEPTMPHDGDGSTTTTVATPTTPPVVEAENPFPGADVSFSAFLSSGQEVPPTSSTAWGSFEMTLAADGTELTWTGRVLGLPEASAGHLHLAPAGENGPVVVPLFEEVSATGPFLDVSGTITAEDLTGPLEGTTLGGLVAEIAQGNVYANVHTSDGVEDALEPGDYPDGEIRGQVLVWTVTAVDGGGTTTTTVPDTTPTTGDGTTPTTAPDTTTPPTVEDTTPTTTGDTTTPPTVEDTTPTTAADTTVPPVDDGTTDTLPDVVDDTATTVAP